MGAKKNSWLEQNLQPSKLAFYLLFHGAHVGLFILGWSVAPLINSSCLQSANLALRLKQKDDPRLAGLNTLTFSVWLSRGAGLAMSFDVAVIPLPMCRNILRWVRPKLRFLPLDESQWFHRQVAYTMLFWTCVHVCAHYVKYVHRLLAC